MIEERNQLVREERKLLLSERQNLFEPNDYINMFVTFDSGENLESAVRAAFKANETTMSRIVLDAEGNAYYEKMEESGCNIISVEEEMPGADWNKVVQQYEKIPFELWNGELMRVFLWSDGKMLIMSHHLAGDGKSICIFLQDVLDALNGKVLAYKPAHVLSMEELHQMTELNSIINKYVASINKKWEKVGKVFTWEDYKKIHARYWKNHASQIIVHTYTEDETAEILNKAHLAKVTVNSYLSAQIASKYTGKNRLGIPISVRGEDSSMTNLVAGTRYDYKYDKRKTVEQNAQNMQSLYLKSIEEPLHRSFVLLFMGSVNGTLLDSVSLSVHGVYNNKLSEKTSRIVGYKGKERVKIGITNLGIVSFDTTNKIGEDSIKELIFLPPAITYTKYVYGISTLNGKITVTYHGNGENE